jgi:hypothetical protein
MLHREVLAVQQAPTVCPTSMTQSAVLADSMRMPAADSRQQPARTDISDDPEVEQPPLRALQQVEHVVEVGRLHCVTS